MADAYLRRCRELGVDECGPFAAVLAAEGPVACKLTRVSLADRDLRCVAASLRTARHVTSLDLSKSLSDQITADGLEALRSALTANASLETLSLAHNPIGDAGATAVAEALAGIAHEGDTAGSAHRCAVASLNLRCVVALVWGGVAWRGPPRGG